MKRAYLIEMTVLGGYAKRLLGTALIMSVCIGLSMRSLIVVPGILAVMFFTVGAITSSAYDEHNDWGLFRLAMSVSRRDVVLGRYGATTTLGLLGAAVGAAAAFVPGAAATVLPLSGDLAEGLRLSPDGLRAMGLSTACCLAAEALITAVETPCVPALRPDQGDAVAAPGRLRPGARPRSRPRGERAARRGRARRREPCGPVGAH